MKKLGTFVLPKNVIQKTENAAPNALSQVNRFSNPKINCFLTTFNIINFRK